MNSFSCLKSTILLPPLLMVSAAILLLASCQSHKPLYFDNDYTGEQNYDMFYVVDTIVIDNPVLLYNKNTAYVAPLKTFMENKVNDKFFWRPDVFVLRWKFDFERGQKYNNRHNYYYGCNDHEAIDIGIRLKHRNVNRFKNGHDRFLLYLISVQQYNKTSRECYDCDYTPIKCEDYKNTFVKVVIPLCE